MPLERITGTVTADQVSSTDLPVNHHWFIRIESTVDDFGTIRFTTRDHDWVGALDASNGEGSSAAWRGGEAAPVEVALSQSNTSILDVSSISFPNVRDDDESQTGYWFNLDRVYGLKNRKVTVWQGWWPEDVTLDADDDIQEVWVLFKGRIGAREHGKLSNLSLNPFRTSHNGRTGSQVHSNLCRFAVAGMFKNPTSCQYPGSDPDEVCGGTLPECIAYDNEINFGGHPLMLKPNTAIQVGPSTQRQRFVIR